MYKVILTYYCSLLLTLCLAILGYYASNKLNIVIDPASTTKTAIYTVLILFTIFSIPAALKLFRDNTHKIEETEDPDAKEKLIVKNGIIRISIIGIGFALNILFFYLLQEKSMIYMAGISAIALFVAKPKNNR